MENKNEKFNGYSDVETQQQKLMLRYRKSGNDRVPRSVVTMPGERGESSRNSTREQTRARASGSWDPRYSSGDRSTGAMLYHRYTQTKEKESKRQRETYTRILRGCIHTRSEYYWSYILIIPWPFILRREILQSKIYTVSTYSIIYSTAPAILRSIIREAFSYEKIPKTQFSQYIRTLGTFHLILRSWTENWSLAHFTVKSLAYIAKREVKRVETVAKL